MNKAEESAAVVEPLLETIEDTARRLRLGRSTIYELLASNEIEAVKIGRSRRVVVASTKRFVERLSCGDAA
jgi:excisionase family DNA binding protein